MKDRDFFKRILPLLVLIFIQIVVIVAWGQRKESFFTDEEFSYDGARVGGYSAIYWSDEDDFIDHYHTRGEFIDRLTIKESDEMLRIPGEFLLAITQRNPYYTLLNAAASIWRYTDIWWTGIALNIFVFALSQLVFYFSALILSKRQNIALILTAIYGFSAGAISLVLYSRCYMIVSFLILLSFLLYLLFLQQERILIQVIQLCGAILAGGAAWKFHQFGLTAFMMLSFCVFLYLLMARRKRDLKVFAMFFVIIGLIGIKKIYEYVNGLLITDVGRVLLTRLKTISVFGLYNNSMTVLSEVGDHLCGNIGFVFIVVTVSVYCIYHMSKDNNTDFLYFIPIGTIILHFAMICIGGALAWRYYSPVYSLIILGFFTPVFVYVCDNKKAVIGLVMSAVILTILEYALCNVSDLYVGTEAARETLEQGFSDMDGYMIIHDQAGENYHYEAAWLWPESSKVYCTYLSTFEEGKAFFPEDESILLWLTIDYDTDEVKNEFLEMTEYTEAEEVFSTDHLVVYECSQNM